MTNDEAEKLARELQAQITGGHPLYRPDVFSLCAHILSGSYKREIENAAYERAAREADAADKQDEIDNGAAMTGSGAVAAKRIRAIIHPPAQKENGE